MGSARLSPQVFEGMSSSIFCYDVAVIPSASEPPPGMSTTTAYMIDDKQTIIRECNCAREEVDVSEQGLELDMAPYYQIEYSNDMIQGFVSEEVLAMLFLFFGLAIAVVIKQIRKAYPSVPYTPTLFVISVGLGYYSDSLGIIGASIKQISNIDPRGILLIFLPPLIFESSFSSDWYIFRKQSVQIFILAFPSVLVSALLIMFSVKVIVGYDESYYNWPEAFMFGSVLSCTDTVAVLALLKEAGAPRKFSSLIEGESLFNDGTCMVLFTISLELVKGSSPHVASIVQLFLELTIGAIVLGVAFGIVSAYLIGMVRNDSVLTLNFTVVSCYILYFVAEYVDLGIKVSGIMALVSMGLYMAAFGKAKIAPQAKEMLHNFWKIYIFVAETIIFILGGVLVGVQALRPDFISMMSLDNFQKLLILYICMTISRFLSISVFMPKLQKEGYGLKWKEVLALTYGGLRGAVGIAFTLILASNTSLNPTFRTASLFNTSGCAFLTLIINAPTASFFIKKIGLCVKSETKQRLFRKFMRECEKDLSKKIEDMKKNQYLQNSIWDKVEEQSGLCDLQRLISPPMGAENAQANRTQELQTQALHQHLMEDDNIDPNLMSEIRNRFCIALKGIIYNKFENNQCSSESLKVLIQCVNLDLDSIEEPLNSWDYLISHLDNPFFFPVCYWLKNKPIIGRYAYSWIYDRVGLLYDVISTYLLAIKECEEACRMMPFEDVVQYKLIEESESNRKLAQSFLDYQIKISYYQIMTRIQKTKAAHSILTYEKDLLKQTYVYGQIDDFFYKQIKLIIEKSWFKLENDSVYKQSRTDQDYLQENQIFSEMSQQEIKLLLEKKDNLYIQKDEPVLKAYEKQKFVYMVIRGELIEEYKLEGNVVYRRKVGLYSLSGVGCMLPQVKELEYTATAVSTVSLFCLPITDLKQIAVQKAKIEALLYKDIFLLNIALNPELRKRVKLDEVDWKKKYDEVSFEKLPKRDEKNYSNCTIILLDGTLALEEAEYKQGYFEIFGDKVAKVTGPAKMYISSSRSLLEPVAEQTGVDLRESHKSSTAANFMRGSIIRESNAMTRNNDNSTAIIRRTLYTKD